MLTTIVGISLSMDAFSLSLAYGTLNPSKKSKIKIAIIIGIFHLIMPLLGSIIGIVMIKNILIAANFLAFIILFIIGLEMLFESNKKDIEIISKKKDYIFFALAVSIDAFSVGITFPATNVNYLTAAITFSIISFIFTYIGITLGTIINNKLGQISTLIGGVILIIIAITILI